MYRWSINTTEEENSTDKHADQWNRRDNQEQENYSTSTGKLTSDFTDATINFSMWQYKIMKQNFVEANLYRDLNFLVSNKQ